MLKTFERAGGTKSMQSIPQTSTARKHQGRHTSNLPALTPVTLFGLGYRVQSESNYCLRVFRATTGSYRINVMSMTCECLGFRSRRTCKHLTGLRGLIEAQMSAYRVEFDAIRRQINRGDLTYLDLAELTREGQEIDDQLWELRDLAAMLRTEFILEVAQ
jgi:hypothetical protein